MINAIVTELRYLTVRLAVADAILVSFAVALFIGSLARIPATFGMMVSLALLFLMALGATWAYLKHFQRTAHRGALRVSQSPARIAPLAVSTLLFGWMAYQLITVLSYQVTHNWRGGSDHLSLVLLVTAFAGYLAFGDWYRRLTRVPDTLPAFTQKRLAQMKTAAMLPTLPERRRAVRPLVFRGYVRLAMIAAMVAAMLALIPHVGLLAAYGLSFGTVAIVFAVLHRLYDL